MRPLAALLALPVLALVAATDAAAEATRTLRVELSADALDHFAVENLAGVMTVAPGTARTVVAIATVHAEDQDLADSVVFEQVAGKAGVPTLRVRYPLDDYDAILYPGQGERNPGFLEKIFGDWGSHIEYDGHRVRVGGGSGVLLYADVEIQVPPRLQDATFRNFVGTLRGRGIDGKVAFDTASGDIVLERVRGAVRADTGSGDVKAKSLEGSFDCDTGSGDCVLERFKGETISCDVGSGNVRISDATARLIDADTGSGDVHVHGGDLETFRADTGSGDVDLMTRGTRLKSVKADTGSGDVRLRLGPDASFEALADQGSGDIIMRYKDAQPILKHKELIGYRRGPGQIRIVVDTGSGDLVIEPGA